MMSRCGAAPRCPPPGAAWRPLKARAAASDRPPPSDWTPLQQQKRSFSHFLDEITCRVLSPAHLSLLGRTGASETGSPAPQRQRSRRRGGSPAHGTPTPEWEESGNRTRRWDGWVAAVRRPIEGAGPKQEVVRGNRGGKMETEQRHKHRRRVCSPSPIQEALSDSERIRLQNSYTASQRANQDLEEKLHAW
ncbi:hypothetical protein EPR50_G00183050 [Perca flavescens]|uniref:Uncharacterized protein n=1 Tax=Perca flavescens TaxID=8167 RepID=A0A484CD08_PERFV|nr:hypothetical protein EPR50_G00183050 [Perca flavescens]